MIEVTTAAQLLAKLKARKAVKDSLRAQGHKVSDLSARDISSWATCYLGDHPELIPPAIEQAKRMILSGVMGKRAQKAFITVRIYGQWIVVPDAAVVTEPNRFGPAVVWPYNDRYGNTQIRCFMPGAGT